MARILNGEADRQNRHERDAGGSAGLSRQPLLRGNRLRLMAGMMFLEVMGFVFRGVIAVVVMLMTMAGVPGSE